MSLRQASRKESKCCGAELEYLEQRRTARETWISVFECAECGTEVLIP